METILNQHWHHLKNTEVIELLETNPKSGLDKFELEARKNKFSPNKLPIDKGPSILSVLWNQINQPLVYILIIAAVVSYLLKGITDSAVIFAVVVLNTIIGFIQEYKAVNAIQALSKNLVQEATVIRQGQQTKIRSEDLVPGDLLILKAGDKIPADGRIIECNNLQINESVLTGESQPVTKTSDKIAKELIISERTNMVYSSTLVVSGAAKVIITATGIKTEIGKIADMISSVEEVETNLTKKLKTFSNKILVAIIILAALLFFVGIFRGKEYLEMFNTSVALAVGLIPEGLPTVITITLAIGVARMAKRNAIIRHLPAVESLGSATVICSDKTGTFTKNEMTVKKIYCQDKIYDVSGSGYNDQGQITFEDQKVSIDQAADLKTLLVTAVVCNDSVTENLGQPTEAALLYSASKAGLTPKEVRAHFDRVDEIAFDSSHKYMAVLVQNHQNGEEIYVKGAPEVILSKSQIENKDKLLKVAEKMAAEGLRVLAMAKNPVNQKITDLQHHHIQDLQFLGFQGIIDPPRIEVKPAIQSFYKANVDVKMITGDHQITAYSIAKSIGLKLKDLKTSTITGKELQKINDKELEKIAQEKTIFARVTPKQKLRLVRALQAQNQITSMTGDGVNDAPALKQADIGVAMGITGTDVSKESADIILTDDNFASIEAAVEEGRVIYDNLKKFIVWTIPTNLGEAFVIVLAVFLGLELPMTPLQILWINLATALFLGLTLAFEQKEKDVMKHPPRPKNEPLVSKDTIPKITLVTLILTIAGLGLFEYVISRTQSLSEARTVMVNIFIFVEMFYLLNCRSLDKSIFTINPVSNKFLLLGIFIAIIAQLGFTYHPFFNKFFDTSALTIDEWLLIIATSIIALILVEIEKYFLRSKRQPAPPQHQH